MYSWEVCVHTENLVVSIMHVNSSSVGCAFSGRASLRLQAMSAASDGDEGCGVRDGGHIIHVFVLLLTVEASPLLWMPE